MPPESSPSELLYHATVPLTVIPPSNLKFTQSTALKLFTRSLPSTSQKALVVELSYLNDENFLYSTSISESDFALLKQQQELTIDFSALSNDISRLLELCKAEPVMKSDLQKAQIENGLIDDLSSLILSTPSKISFKLPLTNQTPTSAASQQQDSTYSAELHLNPISNEHTFKIIEITKFRKITHFKLILQRASDDRIKHFLSVVVQQRSAEAKNLIEQLVQAQLQLNRTNQETLTLQKRGKHAQQLEQYRVENEIQRKRMEDGHASALASLQVQNSQLSDDVSKLGKQLSEMTHNKQSTDEQLSMKTNQLEQSERTRSDLLRQTENLQSQLAQLEKSSKTQSERLIAVESILAEKEKYIQTLLISLESEKRRAGATEEKEQLLQQAHDALAEQLAQAGKEMERGNEQLRLQAEKIRKLVNKVKEKSGESRRRLSLADSVKP